MAFSFEAHRETEMVTRERRARATTRLLIREYAEANHDGRNGSMEFARREQQSVSGILSTYSMAENTVDLILHMSDQEVDALAAALGLVRPGAVQPPASGVREVQRGDTRSDDALYNGRTWVRIPELMRPFFHRVLTEDDFHNEGPEPKIRLVVYRQADRNTYTVFNDAGEAQIVASFQSLEEANMAVTMVNDAMVDYWRTVRFSADLAARGSPGHAPPAPAARAPAPAPEPHDVLTRRPRRML